MQYRVAVLAPGAGQWTLSGRHFESVEEAAAYMAGIKTRFKRVVAVNRRGPARPGWPSDVDQRRLGFARFLVRRGSLGEYPAGDRVDA